MLSDSLSRLQTASDYRKTVMASIWGNLPGADKRLVLDAQGIGDAVDVVEIGDDLDGVMQGPVVEAMGAQALEIALGCLARPQGDLFGIGQ